ncbi:unnamed protein product, partial [Ectocarpus sp. 12 AP-2014]
LKDCVASPPARHSLPLPLPVATGIKQKPAKTTSSAKGLSGTASGVTLTTDLGSDDSGGLSDDDVLYQEQQHLWPAAEGSPPGSVSSSSSG